MDVITAFTNELKMVLQAVAAEGGGARGAEAPPTFKREGQSPPINAFHDVISHNM